MRPFPHRKIVPLAALLLYFGIIYTIVVAEKQHGNSNIQDFTDGLWFSVVTLTTVGYGDFYPVSTLGRLLSVLLILSSIGIFGFIITNIGNFFLNYIKRRKQGYYGTNMRNHHIIIGWNSFSKQVADQVVQAGIQLAIATDHEADVEHIKDLYPGKKVFVLYCDTENMEQLKKINISGCTSVFINVADDSKNLVYLINLKKCYQASMIVALETAELKDTFLTAGAKYVVAKNQISSKLVASYIFEPSVALITEDLMSTTTSKEEIDILQFELKEHSTFIGQKYFDVFVGIKTNYNSTLIGLSYREEGQTQLVKNPQNDRILQLGEHLLVISDATHREQIAQACGH